MSIDICLECTLPICDEDSPECRYVQITRVDRTEYFANYYIANRVRKLGHEIYEVKCSTADCTAMVTMPRTKSGLCERCRKNQWKKERRDAISIRNTTTTSGTQTTANERTPTT